jgi:hypothetical protein
MPNFAKSLTTLTNRNKWLARHRKPVLLTLLMLASLLTACAPVRPNIIGAPLSRSFADSLIREWQESSSRVYSLQGLAKVQFQAPLNSLQGSQVLLAEKPDHLRAETLSPFGSPLLLLVADGGNLGVSLPSQNLYYTGAATAENLDLFVHMPLRPADLVGVLLYQPPLISAWKEEVYALREGGWLLVRYGTSLRQELVFNPGRQLAQASFYENNDLTLRVNYAQIELGSVWFPRRLSLEVPEKHATISLDFTDLDLNTAMRPGVFRVTPPPGAKIVYLADE